MKPGILFPEWRGTGDDEIEVRDFKSIQIDLSTGTTCFGHDLSFDRIRIVPVFISFSIWINHFREYCKYEMLSIWGFCIKRIDLFQRLPPNIRQ